MRRRRGLFKISAILLFLFILSALPLSPPVYSAREISPLKKLSREEQDYFSSLYKDMWDYLSAYVEKSTGLPYDSSAKQPPTSLMNVGLYLASAAVAYQTGLISRDEAAGRVRQALASIKSIPAWRGFPSPWILVRTLKPTYGEEFSYGPHLASLLGGLIVVKTTFPEFAGEIERMLLNADFKSLYDPYQGWLKGGYNMKTQNFAIFQPWGHWYYKHFASETRLLSFYLIARKLVPKDHWFALVRDPREKEGESFFMSGPEEGGFLPQYFAGIFMDEGEEEMGGSQKNYTRYQMKRAGKIKAPVWGWSPSQTPQGRYLTAGELRDEIVAPYASMMAVGYFPKEVYKNLKKAEELGARPQINSQGATLGFRDSLNWRTGEVSKQYVTLSQAAGFLSLANLLYGGVVRQSFGRDAVVQRGFEILNRLPQVELAPASIPEGRSWDSGRRVSF